MPNSIDAALNITNLSAISSGSPAFMPNGLIPENFTSSMPVSGNYTADDLVAQLEPLYDSEEKLISEKDFEDRVLKGYNLLRSRKEKIKYACMVATKYNVFPALKEYFKEYKLQLDISSGREVKSVLDHLKQVMPDKAVFNFEILMMGVAHYLINIESGEFEKAYHFLTYSFDNALKIYGYKESADIFLEEVTKLHNLVQAQAQTRLKEDNSENTDKSVMLAEKTELFIIYCEMLRANEKETYRRKIQEVKDSGDAFFRALEGKSFKGKLSLREEYFKIFPYSSIREGKINFGKAVSSENLPKLGVLKSFNRFLAKFKAGTNTVSLLRLTMEFFHEEKQQERKIPSIIEEVVNMYLQILNGDEICLMECVENLTESVTSISENIYKSGLNEKCTTLTIEELFELAEVKSYLHQIQSRVLEENILYMSWPILPKAQQMLKNLIALSEAQSASANRDVEFYRQCIASSDIEESKESFKVFSSLEESMLEQNKIPEANLQRTNMKIIPSLREGLALVRGDDPVSLAHKSLPELVGRIPTGKVPAYFFSRPNEKDMIFDWFQKVRQETGFDFKYNSADKTPGEIGAFIRRAPMRAEDKQRLIEASEKEIRRISGEKGLREFKKEIGKSTPEVIFDNFYQAAALVATGTAAIFAAWFLKRRNAQEVVQDSPAETAESSRERRQAERKKEEEIKEKQKEEQGKRQREKQSKEMEESYIKLMDAKRQLDIENLDIDFDDMQKNYDSSKDEFRKLLTLRHAYQYAYCLPAEKKDGIAKSGADEARNKISAAHKALEKYANFLNIREDYEKSYKEIKDLYEELKEKFITAKESEENYSEYLLIKSKITALNATLNNYIKEINETPVPDMSSISNLVEQEEGSHNLGIIKIRSWRYDTPEEKAKAIKTDTIISTFPGAWKNFYEIPAEDLVREEIDFTSATPAQSQVNVQFERQLLKQKAATTEARAGEEVRAGERQKRMAGEHRGFFIGSNPFIHSLCTNFNKLQKLLKNPPTEEEIYVRAMRYYIMRIAGALYEAVRVDSQLMPLDGKQDTRAKPLMTPGSCDVMRNLRNQIMHSYNGSYFDPGYLEVIANDLLKKLSESIEKIINNCNVAQEVADFSKSSFVATDLSNESDFDALNNLLEKELAFLQINLKNYSQNPQVKAAIVMALTTIGEISTHIDREEVFGPKGYLAGEIKREVRDRMAHRFGNNPDKLLEIVVRVTEKGKEIRHVIHEYYGEPVKDWMKCDEPVNDHILERIIDKKMVEELSENRAVATFLNLNGQVVVHCPRSI